MIQPKAGIEEDARGVLRARLQLNHASEAASPYTSEASQAGIPPESLVFRPYHLHRIRFNARLTHTLIDPGRLIARVGDFEVDENRFSNEIGLLFGIESAN